MFLSLAQPEPTPLATEAGSYDYMFRWGVNHSSNFVFARIDPTRNMTRLFFSSDGTTIESRTPQPGQYQYPALYERTDGLHWLAFERAGVVVHQAWSREESVERTISRGTSPRWSRDGKFLLMAGDPKQSNDAPASRVVVRNLSQASDRVLSDRSGVLVRSPTWSPDESFAAFYERNAGENLPWRIQVAPVPTAGSPTTVVEDVVVNPDFNSEGPSWEPSGRRVWCFSHRHREQEYYPMVAAEVPSGRVTIIDYPRRANVPYDLALNPATAIPEVAFVGHSGRTRDLFVSFFNHS